MSSPDLLTDALEVRDKIAASEAKRLKQTTKATGDHESRVAAIVTQAPIEVVQLVQQASPHTCYLVAAALHVPRWPKDPTQ